MRAFVASVLPPNDLEFYDAWIDTLVTGSGGALRAIPHRSAHITLAFLGEVPDDADRTAAIVRELTDATRDARPIDIAIGSPVIVQDRRAPRLVMAPVIAGADAVLALARGVTDTLRRTSVPSLGDPKPAHVTLARFRTTASLADAQIVADALSRLPDARRATQLLRVQLLRSTLRGRTPSYDELATMSLG